MPLFEYASRFVRTGLLAGAVTTIAASPYSAEAQRIDYRRIGPYTSTRVEDARGRVSFGINRVGQGNSYEATTSGRRGRENEFRERVRTFLNQQRNRTSFFEHRSYPARPRR